MTCLELWCFSCISCTFLALLSCVVILIRMETARRDTSMVAVAEHGAGRGQFNKEKKQE